MTLIEGIGDEVIQFVIALFFISIVILAWYTTNITNDGTFRTVFLLERRRLRAGRRMITHTESTTIVEGSNEESSETNRSDPTIEENKSAGTSTENHGEEETEETRIVETMDASDNSGTEGLRRRINSDVSKDSLENGKSKTNDDCEPGSSKEKEENNSDMISIKLKYITDELRQVDANLKENIGDFKRRHFQVELETNKIVKLIFNGQILKRDTDTLQSCGLFDNCVVHCVFLPGTNASSRGTGSSVRGDSGSRDAETESNNRNQPNEWHLENYLLTILLFFLAAAWYLRYVYSQLYTVTATIGLILMTGIFTIIMFGMHFPEHVDFHHQRTETVGS